jgi:hypothetical protein
MWREARYKLAQGDAILHRTQIEIFIAWESRSSCDQGSQRSLDAKWIAQRALVGPVAKAL